MFVQIASRKSPHTVLQCVWCLSRTFKNAMRRPRQECIPPILFPSSSHEAPGDCEGGFSSRWGFFSRATGLRTTTNWEDSFFVQRHWWKWVRWCRKGNQESLRWTRSQDHDNAPVGEIERRIYISLRASTPLSDFLSSRASRITRSVRQHLGEGRFGSKCWKWAIVFVARAIIRWMYLALGCQAMHLGSNNNRDISDSFETMANDLRELADLAAQENPPIRMWASDPYSIKYPVKSWYSEHMRCGPGEHMWTLGNILGKFASWSTERISFFD